MPELTNASMDKYYFVDRLTRFLGSNPMMREWLGVVTHESEQINEVTWVVRYTNENESFVLKFYYEAENGGYEAQVRIASLMLMGQLKGHGISKEIINYLVEYGQKYKVSVWIVDVINREWKQYLISQGAKLVQEETREAGAVLYIPEKIGFKKVPKRRYVDEFDRELLNYLVQFFTLEGVGIKDISSTKASETVYDITVVIEGFVMKFQYEKESQAGEAQIRFGLYVNQSGARSQGMPVGMLTNMLNVLLLYCRVHGTMSLWMFNSNIYGSDFTNYFIQRGARMMRDDPSGVYGGTVLMFDRKLQ